MQICRTLILKFSCGYFGQLSQNSLLPQTFLTQCLSAWAPPAREHRTNRNAIKAGYSRKYLQQVSRKRVGAASLDGGISMEEAVNGPIQKPRVLGTVQTSGCIWDERMEGTEGDLFLCTAALAFHASDIQRTNGKTSSWPHSNIVLFVFPEACQLIFISGFGQKNELVNLPSLISVCKLTASWGLD